MIRRRKEGTENTEMMIAKINENDQEADRAIVTAGVLRGGTEVVMMMTAETGGQEKTEVMKAEGTQIVTTRGESAAGTMMIVCETLKDKVKRRRKETENLLRKNQSQTRNHERNQKCPLLPQRHRLRRLLFRQPSLPLPLGSEKAVR